MDPIEVASLLGDDDQTCSLGAVNICEFTQDRPEIWTSSASTASIAQIGEHTAQHAADRLSVALGPHDAVAVEREHDGFWNAQ